MDTDQAVVCSKVGVKGEWSCTCRSLKGGRSQQLLGLNVIELSLISTVQKIYCKSPLSNNEQVTSHKLYM